MNEEYQKKLAISKKAYQQIMELFKLHKSCSPYEINFCWDEYIIVGDEGFDYKDMQAEGVEPSRP